MKPFRTIDTHTVADGTVFTLHEHDGNFYLHNDGNELMSTARIFSEEVLADVGLASFIKKKTPDLKVVIAGLGLGFTLKRSLELVAPDATLQVAELLPQIVKWNQTHLADVNGHALADPRTDLYQGDFFDCLTNAGPKAYHALLFDIDENPESLVVPGNKRMYTQTFFATIHQALKPNGCAAFWLARKEPAFMDRLKKAGFTNITGTAAPSHAKAKRSIHHIYAGYRA